MEHPTIAEELVPPISTPENVQKKPCLSSSSLEMYDEYGDPISMIESLSSTQLSKSGITTIQNLCIKKTQEKRGLKRRCTSKLHVSEQYEDAPVDTRNTRVSQNTIF